jgi:hypothetical protein
MTEYNAAGELAAEVALEGLEGGGPSWFRGVALTTLILSVLTAASALLAGMTAHETLLERTEEIVDLSSAQADRISAEVLASKHEVLRSLGEPLDPDEVALVKEFEEESARLEEEGVVAGKESLASASTHLVSAIAATMFAVAIAVTGLAAVVGRRWLWYAGGALGIAACVPLIIALSRFAS